jgi:hypothetical protein
MNQPAVQSRVFDLLRLARNLRRYEETFTRVSGEGFNVFKILNVGHYEVRTHSPFLAELLNPKGSHGQGPAFLRCFIARLNIGPFDVDSARVSEEFSLGPQTEDEGGRLDILIRDGMARDILIENKIYAGLQPNQLGRYRNFSPKGALVYLTLSGETPEGASVDEYPNLKCISYRTDIVSWLEDCRKEAADAPCVRETITQYIRLIQELTQQNTSTQMNQELVKTVLNDEDSFLAYSALHKATPDIRAEILRTLRLKMDKITNELGLELDFVESFLGNRFGGFGFTNKMLEAHNVKIHFEFNKSDYRDFYFGFKYRDQNGSKAVTLPLSELSRIEFGRVEEPTEWWAMWSWWDKHREWTDETFAAIRFGHFSEDLKTLLERLLKIADRACCTRESLAIK